MPTMKIGMRATVFLLGAASLLLAAPALLTPVRTRAAEPVRFGLDWRAEAEHGGYYEAAATGLYARAGLDVSLRQGGPQVNQLALLLAGRLDFAIASNSFLALNFAREDIPFRAVAAIFQRDPSVLIAHPGQGNDDFAALKGKPIMIGGDTRAGWWRFLAAKFGYDDGQIRPYTFNLAPFLHDKAAIQQGVLGSEPFLIRRETGTEPVVLMIADAGFAGYGNLIVTADATIRAKPDLVRRFVAASTEGWRLFLHGDPAPATAAIKADNPEMTDDLLAYAREVLTERGIVESGDAARAGIGAMTDARWRAAADQGIAAGLYLSGLDPTRAYTLRFVGGP